MVKKIVLIFICLIFVTGLSYWFIRNHPKQAQENINEFKEASSFCEVQKEEICCKYFVEGKTDLIEKNCSDQQLFISYILLKNEPKLCEDYRIDITNASDGTSWLIKNQFELCKNVFEAYNNPSSIGEINKKLVDKCKLDRGFEQCSSIDIGTNMGLITAMAIKNNDKTKCDLLPVQKKNYCDAMFTQDYKLCSQCFV